MFLVKLYHFLFGYVSVRIAGVKPERFINMLMNLNVRFWGIEKEESKSEDQNKTGALRIKMSSRYANEETLKKIAAKTNTDCEIIDKTGVRYLLARHKYRLGIYAGTLIGAALIYTSTFFVWDVKISRSDYHSDMEIIEMLERFGCKPGVLIKNIDSAQIQNKIILASNGKISWLAVNIKGTVANIEVKKAEPAEKIIDRTTPANITASKTGKIIFIDAYEGERVAGEETTVQKGEVLISGVTESEMLGIRIKRAAGKAVAETIRKVEVIIPLNSSEKYYTGNTAGKRSLNILGRNINLYLNAGVNYPEYDRTRETKNLTLFDVIVLPIKISTAFYSEFEIKNKKISRNTAKDIAISKINSIIDSRFGSDENIIDIKSKHFEEEITEDYFYMSCTVELIENIAEETEILIND
ncbi:MAG: sporulation protein YqfD [Oscillospiraceae bacterium]|nr:sporulation protein YqfD [Oscillospiraceae bacterium]